MAQTQFSLINKIKIGRPEHSLTPYPLYPIASHFCLNAPPPLKVDVICVSPLTRLHGCMQVWQITVHLSRFQIFNIRYAVIVHLKAGANQSNISSNIMLLPCWIKCWNGLRNYKIYEVSKKKQKS